MAENDKFLEEHPDSEESESGPADITPARDVVPEEAESEPDAPESEAAAKGEDAQLEAKVEAVEAQQRLREAIERAQADAEAGRDIAAEYESKYYGMGRDQSAPAAKNETASATPTKEEDVPAQPVMTRMPPPPPPLPVPPEETQVRPAPATESEERIWAALAHASLLVTLLATPFSVGTLTLFLIFVPLIIYFAYRERSDFVAYHALQGFAMQVLATIGWVAIGVAVTILLGILIAISGILSFVLVGIPFLLLSIVVLVLFWIIWPFIPIGLGIYSLMAAWETYHGRNFRYAKVADWVDKYLVKYV